MDSATTLTPLCRTLFTISSAIRSRCRRGSGYSPSPSLYIISYVRHTNPPVATPQNHEDPPDESDLSESDGDESDGDDQEAEDLQEQE
ncbi:hypothetical protein MGN70_009878 [Eutypa lata]|nr:hypothetical protein MGN70_009878 [Eutypa lata]